MQNNSGKNAQKSGWFYRSFFDMRKHDKILGMQCIPFVGESKDRRYYVPL